eukprot:gene13609-28906_t
MADIVALTRSFSKQHSLGSRQCACSRGQSQSQHPRLPVAPDLSPCGRPWGLSFGATGSSRLLNPSRPWDHPMKAIGYQTAHPIDHPEALLDITQPDPVATGHDLLVEVHAVSVNPVDTKVRKSSSRSGDGPDYKVLGWDASGIVRAVGPEVTLFQPGDRVWYAGSIARPGTNSELHLVDERIVGHAPKSLDFAEAAALPLTTITAWELLFDRLRVAPGKQPTNKTLLIIGASGGVGSILTQLAARLTSLTVIGTASRPETQQWVRDLGAHHVIDHSLPLTQELARIGHPMVDIIVSLTQTD